MRALGTCEYSATSSMRSLSRHHSVGTNRYLHCPPQLALGGGAARYFRALPPKGVPCASMRALGTCEYSATSSTRSLSRHHIMWARIGTCNCPPQLALGRGRPARYFRALPPKGCASARVCVHWGPASILRPPVRVPYRGTTSCGHGSVLATAHPN